MNTEGSAGENSASDELASETLSGDLRDIMLTHVRSMETPWSKMSEQDQSDKIYAVSNACESIVRRAVSLISRHGFPHVNASLIGFQAKSTSDGPFIEGKFRTNLFEQYLVDLGENLNAPIVLVMASPEEFLGSRGEAEADPDQPGLALDEGGGEPDGDGEGSPTAPDDEDAPQVDEAA